MYIIKGAETTRDSALAFLADGGKVACITEYLRYLKHVRMNCDGFAIRPGKVAVDGTLLQLDDYKERLTQWQRKGVTTVLVLCDIEKDADLRESLKHARHRLINSSIDYVIGVSYPMRKITPSFIRLCKREKVPFLLARVYEESDVSAVAWEWIRDAQFPYRFPIVPDFGTCSSYDRSTKSPLSDWLETAKHNQIRTWAGFDNECPMLSKKALRMIGIAPLKGELRAGGDLDYVLYRRGRLADPNELPYHEEGDNQERNPDVVVLRGRLMKAGKTVYYRPGYGKEIPIRVPGFLTYYS
ncbi:MAG TPA: hypothetical protein VFK44_12950 [Bacillales bacterium]|nr:hypothetical protein [Bacillales bacterium]